METEASASLPFSITWVTETIKSHTHIDITSDVCKDNQFSDITIITNSGKFYCHKVILSFESEVVRSLFFNLWDRNKKEWRIPDMEGSNIAHALLLIYGNHYSFLGKAICEVPYKSLCDIFSSAIPFLRMFIYANIFTVIVQHMENPPCEDPVKMCLCGGQWINLVKLFSQIHEKELNVSIKWAKIIRAILKYLPDYHTQFEVLKDLAPGQLAEYIVFRNVVGDNRVFEAEWSKFVEARKEIERKRNRTLCKKRIERRKREINEEEKEEDHEEEDDESDVIISADLLCCSP